MNRFARTRPVRHVAPWLLVLWFGVWSGRAGDFRLEEAGARVGGKPSGSGHEFHEADAFVNWDLPWEWDIIRGWYLQTRLDSSVGWLGDPGGNAVMLTLGPSVQCGKTGSFLSVEGGVSPTVITRTVFATKDFGFPFQLTSHFGVNCDLTDHLRMGYRFQHMSNGGLGQHNPGQNLQMLSISYLF